MNTKRTTSGTYGGRCSDKHLLNSYMVSGRGKERANSRLAYREGFKGRKKDFNDWESGRVEKSSAT